MASITNDNLLNIDSPQATSVIIGLTNNSNPATFMAKKQNVVLIVTTLTTGFLIVDNGLKSFFDFMFSCLNLFFFLGLSKYS